MSFEIASVLDDTKSAVTEELQKETELAGNQPEIETQSRASAVLSTKRYSSDISVDVHAILMKKSRATIVSSNILSITAASETGSIVAEVVPKVEFVVDSKIDEEIVEEIPEQISEDDEKLHQFDDHNNLDVIPEDVEDDNKTPIPDELDDGGFKLLEDDQQSVEEETETDEEATFDDFEEEHIKTDEEMEEIIDEEEEMEEIIDGEEEEEDSFNGDTDEDGFTEDDYTKDSATNISEMIQSEFNNILEDITGQRKSIITFSEIIKESRSDQSDSFSLTSETPYTLGASVTSKITSASDDVTSSEIHPPSVGEVDRELYYSMFPVLNEQYKSAKMKNNYLQKKLAEYYSNKKMFHVLKEPMAFQVKALQERFEQKLDLYDNQVAQEGSERMEIIHKTNELRNRMLQKRQELTDMYNKLVILETGVAKDICSTSRNIEKLVERLLRRQSNHWRDLIKIRRTYIRVRNKVNDVKDALKQLDHLGEGFTIMDYEQLTIDNRNLKERLEEKEDEMTKLRKQCCHVIQVLAHRREKAVDISLNMASLKEELQEVEEQFQSARRQLIYVKSEKLNIWRKIQCKVSDAGLVFKPNLLRDMAKSIRQVDQIKEDLVAYKEGYHDQSKNVSIIRKRITLAHAMKAVKHSSSTNVL